MIDETVFWAIFSLAKDNILTLSSSNTANEAYWVDKKYNLCLVKITH